MINGVVHITGGGFDNINRILPKNLSFRLERWIFPDIFKWIQNKSKLGYNDMLKIFNCGYGMVLISDKLTNEVIEKYNLTLLGEIF